MKSVHAIVAELARRKVLRVLWIYLVAYAVTVATAYSIVDALDVEGPWFRWIIYVGLALTPLIAFISWRYNLVPPQLVRDPADAAPRNPGLNWAGVRHDAKDAGFVLLSWHNEGTERNEKRFFQPVGVGRESGNDIELPDPRVSRYHAVLWAESGTWRIRDLDSANGTFIDAVRVTGTATLPQTCELRFHPNGPAVSVSVTRSQVTVVG